jgi:hypothetical protein
MTPIILKYTKTPISVNSAYMTRFGYRVLSPAARQFKEDITLETLAQLSDINKQDLTDCVNLKVSIEIHTNTWITKKQTVRKKDISSFEKLLTDSVFSGLGIDDSLIFSLSMLKVVGPEQIIYRIESYEAEA